MEEKQVSGGSQALYCCAGCCEGGGVNIHWRTCLLTPTAGRHQRDEDGNGARAAASEAAALPLAQRAAWQRQRNPGDTPTTQVHNSRHAA